MTRILRTTRPAREAAAPPAGNGWEILARTAFVLCLALVAARMMMSESLRTPGDAFPGQDPTPLSPGPATGLILDLLCWLPALLLLARRTVDRSYAFLRSWAWLPMLLLGGWAAASAAWSADRFAARITSFHWLSAAILFWAATQLVTSWKRLRLVAGTCAGLLIVLTLTGYYFRLADWPDLKRSWVERRQEILREHHWAADSFDARQFEKNILNGAILGFSTSANSYAALLVLLGTVSAAIGLQKWSENDGRVERAAIAGGSALAVAAAIPTLLWAGSRGAAATAVFAALCLGATWMARSWISKRARQIYGAAVAVFFAGCGLVISHGLYHGSLVHSSLTFRWRYWVGAGRLIARHPLLGVGWENFGPRYLAVRLPIASEEPRDPHNFIVRIIVELGIVGGVLLVAWMLRLWWEMTQPDVAPMLSAPQSRAAGPIRMIAWIAMLTVGVNFVASVDLSSTSAFVFMETVRRVIFVLCLCMGMALASLRAGQPTAPGEVVLDGDERPAPWMLYAIVIGIAAFLIHNLIDFALFEPGPMFLFALLAGSAIGMRTAPSQSEARGRGIARAMWGAATLAWIVAAFGLVVPVAIAEGLVHDADDAIRGNRPSLAADDLRSAFERVPYNGDYAFRAALASRAAQKDPAEAARLFDAAVQTDPSSVKFLVTRAEFARESHQDLHRVLEDFAQAVRLDPNNVDLRRRFSRILEAAGQRSAAAEQLKAALDADTGLSPDEPKRLKPRDVKEIREAIQSMGS